MFSLESSYRGDSNENTKYTILNIIKKITLNYPKSAATIFSQGLKNEFETAVVHEPSVFELLKFYCMLKKSFGFMGNMKAFFLCSANNRTTDTVWVKRLKGTTL